MIISSKFLVDLLGTIVKVFRRQKKRKLLQLVLNEWFTPHVNYVLKYFTLIWHFFQYFHICRWGPVNVGVVKQSISTKNWIKNNNLNLSEISVKIVVKSVPSCWIRNYIIRKYTVYMNTCILYSIWNIIFGTTFDT